MHRDIYRHSLLSIKDFSKNYTGLWCVGAFIALIHSFFYVLNIPRMVIERYFDSNLLSNMIFNAAFFLYFLVALFMFLEVSIFLTKLVERN
jgi:hypothetical protein